MRDPAEWVRRRVVPASVRERVFDPALGDVIRERRIRRRRARTRRHRAGVELLYVARVLSLARECRALARQASRELDLRDLRRSRHPMIKLDVVFALRMLWKAPGFTAAAVLATALGIGANTAIFTVVKQVLLQPLPYPDAARIVDVSEYKAGRLTSVSPPNFMDWRAKNQTLAVVSAYSEMVLTLSSGSEPSRVRAGLIDAFMVDAVGVPPLLGRSFKEDDMRPGGRKVVILGYGLWQRVFGGDRTIVSRQVTLEGEPHEVVGVMPRGYEFPDASELWTPLRLDEHDLSSSQRGAHYLNAVGRLREGVTAAQASADLDRIEQTIAAQFPDKVGGYTVTATPLLASVVGEVQRPLLILFGAVAFVLLIACVNVSNLLLARAATRTGEIAVRAALGAGRGRLVRQLLAESIVLSSAGGLAGVLLGTWGVRALMAVAPPDLPRAAAVHVDGPILAFSIALSISAGLIFGAAPAIVGSRPDLSVFLRDVRRDGGSTGGRRRLLSALITAQVALALVLLAGAGLAVRSFERLVRVDPGFRTANVLTFNLSLPQATYPSSDSQTRFFRDYTERIQQVPGVVAAGAVMLPPVTPDGFGGSFTIVGRREGSDEGNAQIRSITPGYLTALSIPLLTGRDLTGQDRESAPPVALLSQSAAQRFWPGENPVGKQLRLHVNESGKIPREIVGVVGDVRTRGMDADPVPVIYVPHTQYGPESMTVVVRATDDPRLLLPQLRAVLAAIGPGVAMSRPRPMDDLVAASVAEPRFRTLLLSLFAIVSLALAAVGLYGVVAFSVNQRRSELGLRIALGADPRDVLRLVLREGMLPVLLGILCGLGGAAFLARVMRTLLFGVDALDPITFTAVAVTLAGVALAACYMPARRAMRVDPAGSLR